MLINKAMIFLFGILSAMVSSSFSQDADNDIRYHQSIAEFDKFKENVCLKVPTIAKVLDKEPPIKQPYNHRPEAWPLGLGGHYYGAPESTHTVDYMELAFINLAYGFSADNLMSFLPDSLENVKRVLDTMALMTKYTCGLNVVPPAYINTAKNLFLWYLMRNGEGNDNYVSADDERHNDETTHRLSKRNNKVKDDPKAKDNPKQETKATNIHNVPFFANDFIETIYRNDEKLTPEKVNATEWDEVIARLGVCLNSIGGVPGKEFNLISVCERVTSYSTVFDRREIPIEPPYERADFQHSQTDRSYGEEVIEAIWWMFSLTFARCYKHAYPHEAWVLNFKQKFMEDIFYKFIPRWQYPGSLTQSFAFVFGNYDVRVARRNLRYCAHAAYKFENLERRALVRPWHVKINDHGQDTVDNYKMEDRVYSPLF